MAKYVAEGAKAAGAEADVFSVSDFSQSQLAEYGRYALGCPAMGAEELEDSEFQPFYEAVKPALNGKKVALFGSYGWGGGEWMKIWEADCFTGAPVKAHDSVISEEAPNDDVLAQCKGLGASISK
jgi:flavodoxin short chain